MWRKKTDFDGFKFDKPYTGGKYKILMVASDERYLEIGTGFMRLLRLDCKFKG
jgi:chaperone hchA